MAKRLSDTDKWKHAWLRKLSPKMKCAWFYVLDNCDHAGIWIIDFEAMGYHIGEQIDSTEFNEVFKEKILLAGNDKLFIPTFIRFQYKLPLNPLNKVHKSVLDRLSEESIKPLASPFLDPSNQIQSNPRGLLAPKDKEKEKEKDMDMDKEKEKEEGGMGETKEDRIAWCEKTRLEARNAIANSLKPMHNAEHKP